MHATHEPGAEVMIRVKAAFFSLTPPAPRTTTAAICAGTCSTTCPSSTSCPASSTRCATSPTATTSTSRIAATGHLEDVGNVVNYLVGDPVQQTHDDFMELGRRLAEMGRFPEVRPSLQLRMPALLHWYAAPQALISAEVVPFRPHRGVVVIVEEPAGERRRCVAAVAPHRPLPGRARRRPASPGPGCTARRTPGTCTRATQGDPQYTTVIYLDEDPLATTKALAPLVEERWRVRRGAAAVRRPAADDDRVGGVALTWTRRVEELQARVRRLEDESAIRRLIMSYGPAADAGLTSFAGELWLEDGVYDWDADGEPHQGSAGVDAMLQSDGHQGLIARRRRPFRRPAADRGRRRPGHRPQLLADHAPRGRARSTCGG